MRYKHLKSGNFYEVLHQNALVEKTLEPVVIYQGEDGQVWTRPQAEFFDGRFVPSARPDPVAGVRNMLEQNARLLGVSVEQMRSIKVPHVIGQVVPLDIVEKVRRGEYVPPPPPETKKQKLARLSQG